jgi:hypothetical protein
VLVGGESCLLFVDQFGNLQFDTNYENIQMQALEFSFRCNRFLGQYPYTSKFIFKYSYRKCSYFRRDRHVFFEKITNQTMLLYDFRLGFGKLTVDFLKAKKYVKKI